MKINIKISHSKILYIFFTILSLILYFFSTVNLNAKAFNINALISSEKSPNIKNLFYNLLFVTIVVPTFNDLDSL